MQKPPRIAVTPDELRRAFTVAYLAPDPGDDPEQAAGEPPEPAILQALRRQFAADRAMALFPRVLLVMLWLETDSAELLVAGESLLGVPEIHPAVFDVAASHSIPSNNIPLPGPFMRALEKRLRTYDILSG